MNIGIELQIVVYYAILPGQIVKAVIPYVKYVHKDFYGQLPLDNAIILPL